MGRSIIARNKMRSFFKNKEHKHLLDMIITSKLTEKTVNLEEKYNIVTLVVPKYAKKEQIAMGFEAVFSGTKVLNVNVANYKPVKKNNRGRVDNSNKGYKKAYIRLSKDSEIELGENQTAITRFTNKDNKKVEETNV